MVWFGDTPRDCSGATPSWAPSCVRWRAGEEDTSGEWEMRDEAQVPRVSRRRPTESGGSQVSPPGPLERGLRRDGYKRRVCRRRGDTGDPSGRQQGRRGGCPDWARGEGKRRGRSPPTAKDDNEWEGQTTSRGRQCPLVRGRASRETTSSPGQQRDRSRSSCVNRGRRRLRK